MNPSAESILGFLSKLLEADALRQGLIEATLGIALHLDSTQSNPEFNFYRYKHDKAMQQASLVKAVDFRVPVSPDRSGDEFLHVTLEPSDKLNIPVIAARYGQPQKVDVPTPQESLGTGIAVTYVYFLGKREASFSFGPPPHEALLTLSLARHRE
jgi:hypothetical protein